MGQQVATQCQCNDGIFRLCVPEAPTYEQHNEINDSLQSQSPYPGVSTHCAPVHQDLYRSMADDTVHLELVAPHMPSHGTAMVPEDCTITGLVMPSPRGTPVQNEGKQPWYQRITYEEITSNLEDSEEMVYGEAFSMFLGGQNGYVGLDSAAMRDFVSANSRISTDDIDLELLKVASPDEGLSRNTFLALLREFPIVEASSIAQFLNLSANGEDMGSEECRTGLLMFGQDNIASDIGQQEWERILDTVMSDAGVIVKMDQWIVYCKLMGRVVRLSRYARSQKEAVSVSRGTNLGVVGGA